MENVKVIEYEFYPYCLECGGKIVLTPPNGRSREIVKGYSLPIPEKFRIPTCQDCGDELWAPELSEAIDSELKKIMQGGSI